jgi:hypothetical protein
VDDRREPNACANCGTPQVAAYCGSCGQKRVAAEELTLAHHARRVADEVLHLDSKTLRSLAALLRPGHLTAEYVAGRRQRYLSPLKVYLLSAALFFLVAPLAGFTLEAFLADDTAGQLTQLVTARMKARGLEPPHFHERFDNRLQTVYTLALGTSVVAAALLLAALYHRREPRVGADVVFALHYVAFLFLVSPPASALRRGLELHPMLMLAAMYALIAPYLFVALRRVHGEPRPLTALKVAVLLVLTLVIDMVVNLAAFGITLALV